MPQNSSFRTKHISDDMSIRPCHFCWTEHHTFYAKTKKSHSEEWLFMVVPGGIEPPTQGFSVLCSTDWATEPMVAREGFEPTTSGLWARRATRLLYLAMWYERIWRRSRDSNPGASFPTYRFSRPDPSTTWVLLHSGPWRTRTFDQSVMSRQLWPTELRVREHSVYAWSLSIRMVARVGLEPTIFRVWTDRSSQLSYLAILMVGMAGFEPVTPWSQIKCTTKLCYIPTNGAPDKSRTRNLLIRSQMLYPVELPALTALSISAQI